MRRFGIALFALTVVKRVSAPPSGALTDCFSSIRGSQFSALNNNRVLGSTRQEVLPERGAQELRPAVAHERSHSPILRRATGTTVLSHSGRLRARSLCP